ncbi:unnamed protein product [Prorocentrum cordatum]|uniref:MurL N-terminal domain-containing protein n=1 Tax=Prorocentrum cordatum TaxID=2364126 RepID=A0ABN9WJ20_9DINO|nr:unnamed protein product [Polarella glacialis]
MFVPTSLLPGDGVGEFSGSPRLQGIVEASGSTCLVMEHDFGLDQVAEVRARRQLGRGFKVQGNPWAALVAFDSVIVATALGFDTVAVGNERSANFGNGVFLEGAGERLEVNHQFDKSLEFERAMHLYARKYLDPAVYYFSPLQQLWESQIAQIFCSRLRSFQGLFISCNSLGGCQRRSWPEVPPAFRARLAS